MFDYLYEWMKNLAFYMILMTAAIQVLPNNGYKKYIRFFTGLILVVLLMTPVLKLFNMNQGLDKLYNGLKYRQELKEMEQAAEYVKEVEEKYLEQEN